MHAAQHRIVHEASRFNVLACGRRFGKTTLGLAQLVPPALEGYPVAYFAPTYKMMSDFWRETERTLRPVTKRTNAQGHRIELITGGIVDMWSLDSPDVARGRKYKRAITDEAAMIMALGEAWQSVIRPTLADYEGDAWFLSTPRGMNYFRTIYGYGQDVAMPEWASWQMPTSANPYIKASEVEAMRRELPERRFAQEVEAVFLDDAGGVFRNVQAAATAVRQDVPVEGHQYVMGVDLARRTDFTVLSVVDCLTRQQVWQDRFNHIDWSLQVGRILAAAARFTPAQIIVDQTGVGDPIVEQLRRELPGVSGFLFTNATKAQVIEGLALAFERGEVAILNDPVLLSELQAYESERTASGTLRYNAPEGQHDDTVIALALAWHGASRPSPVDYLSFVELA
jgi:hypothetical protein